MQLKRILKKSFAGFTTTKQILNTVIVFRKQIISVIFTIFGIWSSLNIYDEVKHIERINKQISRKSPIPSFFKHDVGSLYKNISDIVSEKDILLANDQKFTLLKKDPDKVFLNVDYEMFLRNDFVDTVELLEKFAQKKLVHRLNEIVIEKKSDKTDELEIKLKFRAIAYDKIS